MYLGKPIIGLAGGIGSGKSFVARCFGELGCHVIDSDAQVRQAYRDPVVIETLKQWWGANVVDSAGNVNRKFIAQKVFQDSAERKRLENLLHPLVAAAREREMKIAAGKDSPLAFVWDTPLLFETGMNQSCDFVVFIDSPPNIRLSRVSSSRGWTVEELNRRENLQLPLDTKRKISDYIISNTADAAWVRDQVRDLLPRILVQVASRQSTGGHL